MKPTRVLRVPSLAAFVQEIPPVNGRPAVVRLNAVESFLPNGKTAIPRKSVGLSLQGVNAQGELVLKTVATIVKDSQDKHHQKCSMKW